ncbi:hypothetical protein Tco_0249424, partial [Tanacetum coccineum]
APEVAWSPTLKANNGICICPLGSWVVVVTVVVIIVIAVVFVCSRRPAPTVLGQVTKFLAVSAFWCTRTVMVEVTLGASRFSSFIRSPVPIPGSISATLILPFVLPFVLLVGLVISRSVLQLPLVFSQSVNPPFHQASCHLNSLLHGLWL